MKVLQTSTNEVLYLEDHPFAKGGEGVLYKVLEPTSYVGYVAKIYHSNKKTKQRLHKLRYLIKNPPVFDNPNQASLVSWPVAILEINHEFVGFLMPIAKGEPLEILAMAKLPKRLSPKWARFELGNKEALMLRQKVCFNIAVALYHIHQTGHYVMVDFKPDNILIQSNGLISLVDMDSIEIVEGKQMLFPAAMATPEYAPPEFHTLKRSAKAIPLSWDTFSMAVIFYKILLGIHPFAATTTGKYEQAVGLGEKLKFGLFVHNKKLKNNFSVIPLPHLAFFNFSSPIQYLFNLCFIQGVENPVIRPTAEDWCMALDDNFKATKILHAYEIPEPFLDLKITSLAEERAFIFEFSFEMSFGRLIEKNVTAVLQKIKAKKRFSLKRFFLNLFKQKNKAQSSQPTDQIVLKLDIPTDYLLPVNTLIFAIFERQQKRKEAYRKLVMTYHKSLKKQKEFWTKTTHFYEKKCALFNRERREKLFEIKKTRNNQPLWKQFVGKSAKQKQHYLKKKYLPQQLHQLDEDRKQKIEAIEKEQQVIWRELETGHYDLLSKIDAHAAPQKRFAKEREEKRFVKERQRIIDAIHEQKQAAESYCEQQTQLLQSSVGHYCEQLEAIEAEALNKKMAVESSYDLKFNKLLEEIEEKYSVVGQDVKNIKYRFLLDFNALIEEVLQDVDRLGIERDLAKKLFLP